MISINKNNRNKCNGCTACKIGCPTNCISMKEDNLGFLYPHVDENKCIDCSFCERVCPELNQKSNIISFQKEVYAAFSKNDSLRKNSSSGGIFSLIATSVIMDKGIVFGAAFEEDFHSVKHILIYSIEDLHKIRGSKYAQSNLNNTFVEVKKNLDEGKKVLFSGTPCQIAGLNSFLQKRYDNLYLIDFVCHGVPAPSVWKEYIKYLEKKAKGKACYVTFRDKRNGWANYSLKVIFNNKKSYIKEYSDDMYMRGFLHDYYLRPSCYDCAHKGIDRISDITLGDLWGADKIIPEHNDDKGISLVIVSSSKGSDLLKGIKNNVCSVPIDISDVLLANSALIDSAKMHQGVVAFEKEFQNYSIESILRKYCSRDFFSWFKMNIKRSIKKWFSK